MIEEFNSKSLFISFFGSSHAGEKFELNKIKNYIDKFKPDVVLVEGNFDKFDFENEEQAIDVGLEAGYASFIAKRNGIKVLSNDPPLEEDIDFIVKKYGKDLAFLYFVLRQINQTLNIGRPIGGRDLKENIGWFKSLTFWKDFDYSEKHFNEVFKDNLENEFQYKDYSSWFDPTRNNNILNEITKILNVHRDDFLIRRINELKEKFNRIFIVKGNFHLRYFREHIGCVLK